ncbi:MAG: selenide, water dikinase SelD [Proteobacteria bacterium]|jgi:selenide,water dikinase|nr:selenide, water dikinase SelD [Pseudomonadota bacterium]
MNAPDHSPVRLTQFAHGGGCGCKIAPAVLQDFLAGVPASIAPPDLLVGTEHSDDAAVYRLNERQAIVATTDFFTPIVDDPHDFGAIAATNALSDIYAMGATPLFALALVGMPVDKLPGGAIRAVLAGGNAVCRRAGIPIAGGHTIDSAEPIYGLAAIGVVDPAQIKRNGGAQPGDLLILGKPLGIGLYSAAIKRDRLPEDGYRDMIACTTQLNTPGIALGALPGVHALTDVTGFGLLGHLLEICRASSIEARVSFAKLPKLAHAASFARDGCVTGASGRNWASYGAGVTLDAALGRPERDLLTDPQTSGGLLVACAAQARDAVLEVFAREGFDDAAVIGDFVAGAPRVIVG